MNGAMIGSTRKVNEPFTSWAGSSQIIMDNQVRYQARVSDNSYSYDEWLWSPIGRNMGLFTNGVIGVNLS